MPQEIRYPFEAAGRWLRQFLRTHASANGLVCRAVGAMPQTLREALADPKRLSRTQWEVLREATAVGPQWDGTPTRADIDRQLAGLKEVLRVRRHKTPEPLARLRQANLQRLAGSRGAVGALAQLTGVTYQAVSQLKQGENAVTANRARDLERTLGLPALWFDHEDWEVPASALDLLGTVEKRGPAMRVSQAAPPAQTASAPQLPSALHSAVLEKFVALSRANRINDKQAFELLGRLMEFEAAEPTLA